MRSCALRWTHVLKQQWQQRTRGNMVIFAWVNDLVTKASQLKCGRLNLHVFLLQYVKMRKWLWPAYYAYYWQRLCTGRVRRGHCLLRLKEEKWHAVSLSWRSLLSALALPDTRYSNKAVRRTPPACRGIPPFNWAFTQDSFHPAPFGLPRSGLNHETDKTGSRIVQAERRLIPRPLQIC